MQSSKQNQNQKAVIKQSMQSMQKTIVPFNQQLLNLQKKIQQVQSKNELILQKIHKAYDFKKSKNKVFYDASQDQPDYTQGMIVKSNVVQQRVGGNINCRRNQLYPGSEEQYMQPQPTQFQTNSARKEMTRPFIPNLPISNISNRYQLQLNQLQNILPGRQSTSSPSSGNDLTQDMQQQPQSQQTSSRQHQVDESINEYHEPVQDYEQQSSEQEQDFKSHSNYSDIQKRKRITQNFKRRQKDFSDIKSTFQDRRNLIDQREQRRLNKHTPKKSYIFSSVQNNSSYSEGNLPNKEDIPVDDLQMIESPITTNPNYFKKERYPQYRESMSIPNQLPRNPQTYSTNQIYGDQSYSLPPNTVMASVPNIPHQSMQMTGYSLQNRSSPYQQQMSQNQVSYLSDMYKAQRQKSLALQKQVEQKQESIQHLKMYKKSFRKFRDHTFHLFQQAFDQYVETFLRNRLYKIEKAMRKNQNKLAALLMQVKDFKEQRAFNHSLRKNLSQNLNRRSYSSTQQPRKPNAFQQRAQQDVFEQNYSTISSRSRQRSISGKNRKSQDKSVTKKSSHSQHLIMKKEFTNIAENYQTMIKVKNEEIQKYEAEVKESKSTIQMLEQQNNSLKIQCQQQQTQLQTIQLQNQLAVSSVESQQPRKNSGNLRILSRSSSKSDIKKSSNTNALVQENQQLLQKIKGYQQELQRLNGDNTSLQEQLQAIHEELLTSQSEMKLMAERIFQYQQKALPLKDEKILSLESTVARLTKDCQDLNDRNVELNTVVQTMRLKLGEKDKKILQLDSAIYLKNSEIKKVQNLLTLKTYKLQEFNKLLLMPATNQPLNDSISSIIQQPHNKTTFLMLQNLEKQLEEEKHQKEVEFLKLKRSYEAKIEQLKVQFEDIVLENQKLADKLNAQNMKEKTLQEQKQELNERNHQLKEQVDRLQKEVTFLTEKINFYQAQRQTGRTGSFGESKRVNKQKQDLSQDNLNYMKPHTFEQQDFEDFPSIEQNDLKRKEKSASSWKPVSGQIQLLDQSSYYTGFNGKKAPSEENNFQLKKTSSINQNIQQKLSLIKDENIELSQKVAKLQKQNNFFKQTQIQLTQKYQQLKNQLSNFAQKYNELQNNNQQLIQLVEQLERERSQLQSNMQINSKQQPLASTVDWKQVEKNIEPVELRGSAMYFPWSFAEKDDVLLEKSSKDFDIRDSIVSNFHANRPSRESRQSVDKKIDQLTKKLSETQSLLQNKEKINEQLVIGFTKKIDKLNTQLQEQAKQQTKIIEKYIQQNSKLRKDKEKLEEQISTINSQASRQPSIKPQQQEKRQHLSNQILDQADQIDLDQNITEEAGQFGLMEERIEGFNGKGFMLGINQLEQYKQNKQTHPRQNIKFNTILQEDDIQFEGFEENSQKIQLLEKQVKDLEQTVERLQKFLEDTLNKVKQKEEEKFSIVQELQKKSNEVDELKDLIELKQIGKSHTLTLSKSINYGHPQRSSIEKSQRPRLNSITSLKYSHTNQCDRKSSFEEQINFDFLDQSNPNKSINLEHSRMSGMYSQNMSMIFEKEENFLEQVRKAKNKRKQEGKLLRKTFEYIKKLRVNLNAKNKQIKIMQMRIKQLKDNCWLWKKDNEPHGNSSGVYQQGNNNNNNQTLGKNHSQIRPQTEPHQHEKEQSYQDHNQSLSDQNIKQLVDSRLFECNSQDLNKKKPHRHNHYKKLEYDTKLIVEQNKILTKQIEMLQEQLIKIEQQQNGLMAVKELYKEEIRALNRQNQQLTNMHNLQIQKMQDKLQCSEGVHNFEAIKQLFKKIIDNVGVILHPGTSQEAKKKTHNQLKEEKRKQAQECIKVICSILNYEENVRNQLCLRLCGQQPT